MGKVKDLTGWIMREHGVVDSRLTVIQRVENDKHNNARWLCECSCPAHNKIIVKSTNLIRGDVKSCGCLRQEMIRKFNTWNLDGEYGIGYTTKGEEFWFDKDIHATIEEYCWYYDKDGYVTTRIRTNNSISYIKLHNLVMGVTKADIDNGVRVDHKEHLPRQSHKVDNRKSNLRIVSLSRNSQNCCLSINNTSGKTGVSWCKQNQQWRARITVNNTQLFLGYFNNFDDAVKARKDAEEKYFGEYSYDNSQAM